MNDNTMSFDDFSVNYPFDIDIESDLDKNNSPYTLQFDINSSIEEKLKPELKFLIRKKERIKKNGRPKRKKDREEHTKYHLDNMNFKILTNFVNFLINFVNAFLEESHIYHLKFEKVSGEFLKIRNLIRLKTIINSPLSYILEQDISKKFKYKDPNYNHILLTKIVGLNNQQLKKILNMKIKSLYSDIYLENNSTKLYKDYGIKKELNRLNHFLERLEKKKNDIQYINLIRINSYKLISHIENTKPKRREDINLYE